jgi:hypothetical protein
MYAYVIVMDCFCSLPFRKLNFLSTCPKLEVAWMKLSMHLPGKFQVINKKFNWLRFTSVLIKRYSPYIEVVFDV